MSVFVLKKLCPIKKYLFSTPAARKYCVEALFLFAVWHRKNDSKHSHCSGNRHYYAGYRAGRDENKRGKQHHCHHNAHCSGLLRSCHAAVAVVAAYVGAQPRLQQPLLQSRRTTHGTRN